MRRAPKTAIVAIVLAVCLSAIAEAADGAGGNASVTIITPPAQQAQPANPYGSSVLQPQTYQQPQAYQAQTQGITVYTPTVTWRPAYVLQPYALTGAVINRKNYATPLRNAFFGKYRYTPVYTAIGR